MSEVFQRLERPEARSGTTRELVDHRSSAGAKSSLASPQCGEYVLRAAHDRHSIGARRLGVKCGTSGRQSRLPTGTPVEHLSGVGQAEPVCYRCPECGWDEVVPTVKTVGSTYCRCPKCGWLWHEERSEPPRDDDHQRRRTDW